MNKGGRKCRRSYEGAGEEKKYISQSVELNAIGN
jgi:hypothetical protein